MCAKRRFVAGMGAARNSRGHKNRMLDQQNTKILESVEADDAHFGKLPPSRASLARLRAFIAVLWPWRWRIAAIGVALIVLGWVGTPIILGPVVAVDPVVRADFVHSIVVSGNVEAPFRVNIGSQITGVVARVAVNEGQVVKGGDTLVVLDDRELRAAVVQGEGAVAQAEARLRQLRELTLPSAVEALTQAKATLLNAEQSYERTAKLSKDGFATTATLEDAKRGVDIAKAQVRSAEFQVFTNRPSGSDYVMADTQLHQAQANLLTAQSRLSYTVIVAPRDGVLISRNVEQGNVVQPSNVLMMLSPSGDTQLSVLVDERNLGFIALGQKALASADAFPNERFPAEVAYINPGVDLQRASVEVKLSVPNPPAYLRQDMTVSVDIEAARRSNALIVPSGDVHDLLGAKPWVLIAGPWRATRQEVKIGLSSAGKAEVLEGLQEGETIIPAKGNAILDGSRLRARLAAARAP
jgi:HlyD family secretion protein